MIERSSGILLHISSLPGRFGIGDLGQGARRFVEFLSDAGQSYWQVLPMGVTGYGDSPYQSFSAFAGNPYFIDFEPLVESGLLTGSEASVLDRPYIDYGHLYAHKIRLLRCAFRREESGINSRLERFAAESGKWLGDFALFMALRDHHGGLPVSRWSGELRTRRSAAVDRFASERRGEIRFWIYTQYLFWTQWDRLRRFAASHGVRIIGDLPIYAAEDSADLWGNPALFEVDGRGRMISVAGVPPDAFSSTGQLWGNPLYRWEAHEATGFSWWIDRMRHHLERFDLLRLDHFRGFESYWSVPAGQPTAERGEWKPGPGEKLFRALDAALRTEGSPVSAQRFIAEDLGVITPEVDALRRQLGCPGIRVFQFGFDGAGDNPHRPDRCTCDVVAYTGTHDNDTSAGWLDSLAETDFARVRRFLDGLDHAPRAARAAAGELGQFRFPGSEPMHLRVIRAVWSSEACLAIAPFQDLLGLGSDARMNRPSTAENNWKYRARPEDFSPEVASKLYEITKICNRLGGNRG